MHQASIATSKRLQRVIQALKDYPNGLTTKEIILLADVCAVSACVSELRAEGVDVTCEYIGRTERGASVFRYKLDPKSERIAA